MSAFSGAAGSPFGGGMRAITASRMSSMPSPVLALARTASCASMPMMSSISSITRSGSADGRSILFSTGTTVDALLDRGVAVGDRLRFDALRRVDDQQRAFAGGERARHLVGEVDVAGRVDQVELVGLAVARLVAQRRGLRLDGDAALALEVHRVEHLRLHLALGQAAAALDEAIGERRLAVVDVRDDGEVADVAAWRSEKQRGTAKCPSVAMPAAVACVGRRLNFSRLSTSSASSRPADRATMRVDARRRRAGSGRARCPSAEQSTGTSSPQRASSAGSASTSISDAPSTPWRAAIGAAPSRMSSQRWQ